MRTTDPMISGLEGSKGTYLCLHLALFLSLFLVVVVAGGLGSAQYHSIHHWNSTG